MTAEPRQWPSGALGNSFLVGCGALQTARRAQLPKRLSPPNLASTISRRRDAEFCRLGITRDKHGDDIIGPRSRSVMGSEPRGTGTCIGIWRRPSKMRALRISSRFDQVAFPARAPEDNPPSTLLISLREEDDNMNLRTRSLLRRRAARYPAGPGGMRETLRRTFSG